MTIRRAAAFAGVKFTVMHGLVQKGLVPSECRAVRPGEGHGRAYGAPPNLVYQHDLEALMSDAARWKDLCDKAVVFKKAAAPRKILEAERTAGEIRHRVEDALEAKRIGIPVEEWA